MINIYFSQLWKLEIEDQGVNHSVPGVSSLAGLQMASFLLCLYMAEVERATSLPVSCWAVVLHYH
jgi:hypothetical protein